MTATARQNGVVHDIPPPSEKKQEIRDKLLLVLEVLWLSLLTLPCILLAIFRTAFPGRGKSLRGKVVLVTGAGRGLGRGLALGFAEEGCKVAVADVNLNNATNTADKIIGTGGTAKPYYCNVAKVEDVRTLREAVTADLGPVDILVNNAGLIYAEGEVDDCTEADIRAVTEVNLLSHFWTVKEFLPSMKARNSGHVVAIASLASFYGGAMGSAYTVTKFGVYGLMEVVRTELEARPNNNIKTSTAFPYFINTSAQYVNHWDLRFPPMSIDQAVEAIIAGVKRDQVSIFIPWYLQSFTAIGRLLPRYILDRFLDVISFRIQRQTKEEIARHPITYIINDINKSGHDKE